MPVSELKAFLGVNLRRERLKLEDFDLARAINADLNLAIGTIKIRRGRKAQFATALADLLVRALFRISSRRYRVADYGIYRNQTKVYDGLSLNERTTIIPFRPLLDNQTWAFFADDSAMRKDDGMNNYKWGIAPPIETMVAEPGVGTGLDGSYSYRHTHVRFTSDDKIGHEGNPSPLTEGVSPDEQNVGLSGILHPTDLQVNGFGFYRTVNGGADHFLEKRVEIPSENTYAVSHGWEVTGLPDSTLALVPTSKAVISDDTPAVGKIHRTREAAIDNSFGSVAWQSKGNVGTSDDAYAYVTTGVNAGINTHYLVCRDFRFEIAVGATIVGIEVLIERKKRHGGTVVDQRIRIVKGGSIGSTDRANTNNWPAVDTIQSYGDANDLWGETWTPADINKKNFGVAISAHLTDGPGPVGITAFIDQVRIKVYTAGESAKSRGALRATHTWESDSLDSDVIDIQGRRVTGRWEITDGYLTAQTLEWAFNSALPDLSLGSQVETTNDVPPNANFAVSHAEHVFLLGDAANPHYLYWPKRFRPEAFPPLNFIEIGNPHDPLQAAVSVGGLLGVFSRQTKYRVLGNASSGFVHQEALSKRGTRSPYSVNGNEKGVMFVSDDGVFQTNMVGEDSKLSQEIEPLFHGEIVNDYLPVNQGHAAQIVTAFFRNRLFMAYPSGSSGRNDMLGVYSLDTQKWYFWDMALASLYVEEDGHLTGGGDDGFVYDLEDGKSDAGQSITLEVETKDIAGDSQNIRKIFRTFRVDADTDKGTMTCEVLVDGKSLGTFDITGNREKAINRIAGAFGYSARLRITYSGKGDPKIYGCLFEYENMRAAP